MLQFTLVILLLTFVTTVLLVYGLYVVLFNKRIATLKRLEASTGESEYYAEAQENTKLSAREQMSGAIGLLVRLVPKKEYLERKKKKLMQAAILMKAEEFLGISIIAGLLAGSILFLASGNMLTVPFGFAIGFMIPDVFLNSAKRKRSKKLNDQLPEALNIVSNGLRAGYSFPQSMSVAAKELDKPISDEFARVIKENTLGKPIDEALKDMSMRAEDEDIDMFVTALIIQRQVGGNLAEVLGTISETIRERVKLKGEIKTMTAQGKLSGVVITLLPIVIAFAITLLNPEYITVLLTTTIGQVLVAAAVVMEIIGVYLLTKIIDIDI